MSPPIHSKGYNDALRLWASGMLERIRITIGSDAELDRLTDALAEFLETPSPM